MKMSNEDCDSVSSFPLGKKVQKEAPPDKGTSSAVYASHSTILGRQDCSVCRQAERECRQKPHTVTDHIHNNVDQSDIST